MENTKGKWYASPNGVGKGTSINCKLPDDKGTVEIAVCNFDNYRCAETLNNEKITEFDTSTSSEEANAKLLSAAPEMYEVLNLLVGAIDRKASNAALMNYVSAAKKALQK